MFEQRDIPFRHWVDETFLTFDDALAAAAEFPAADDQRWHTFNAARENAKSQYSGSFGPATEAVVARLLSFTGDLEELTGISPLRADLLGGGMHQTTVGGHLDIHVDFNEHPRLPGWRRALNLLVYLNDWRVGDGGELELWDGQDCRAVIPPVAGTAVLFPTSDTSWHGHPNPLNAQQRRSIAVYYFTSGPVERSHTTEWLHAS